MRAFAIVVGSLLALGGIASADATGSGGSIVFEIVDGAKKGVPGVGIVASVDGAPRTATTGSVEPSDGELAEAARKDAKAIDALKSRYNARAQLDDLPYGTISVTIALTGAKALTVVLTEDKPIWKVTAKADPKSKKLVGAPVVVFDEVASAQAIAARAKAETAKARAAQERARDKQAQAEADAQRARDDAEAAREKARAADESARAKQAQAEADARRARDEAEAERLRRARAEAPSKVSVTAGRCDCVPGNQIKVRCEIRNNAEVPVTAALTIFAEGGTFGVNANGKGKTGVIAPRTTGAFEFLAALGTNLNCKSCKNQKCTLTSVTPQ